MTNFYLGSKDEDGSHLARVVEFKVSGESAQITHVPGEITEEVGINDAREQWSSFRHEGFIPIDARLAIASSARIRSKEAENREQHTQRRGRLLYGNRTSDEDDYRF